MLPFCATVSLPDIDSASRITDPLTCTASLNNLKDQHQVASIESSIFILSVQQDSKVKPMGTSSSKQPFNPTKQSPTNQPTDPVKQDAKKPSLWARKQEYLLGSKIPHSDEDMKRWTGKTNDELKTWAENAPGVGKNQKAGRIGMGLASGGVANMGE